MADLKFGSVTPGKKDIRVGSDIVDKIYQGTTQVWPSSGGSYLVQNCVSGRTSNISAVSYWTFNGNTPVLTPIPSVIADETVLKISFDGLQGICVEIIEYQPSIETTFNYYFISTPTYSNCTDCSPLVPIPTPGPSPQPSTPYLVQICATGEEFFVDSSLGYIGTTPVNVSDYQLSIGNTLLVKNAFNGTPKCATIISNTNIGVVTRYFDFINGTGIGSGCPGDPGPAVCID
jgi:hypothetical protein